MPPLEKVLSDTQEISDRDRHPFKIPNAKQTDERLVGDLLGLLVPHEPAGEAEHPVVIGLVELTDDAGARPLIRDELVRDEGVGRRLGRLGEAGPVAQMVSGSLLFHGRPLYAGAPRT